MNVNPLIEAETVSPEAAFATPGQRVWRRFVRNRLNVAASGVVVALAVISLVFGIASMAKIPFPSDPNATSLESKLRPPSAAHWMGTDQLGRDVFSRVLHGSYISLTVGFVAVGVALGIGTVVGAISGYCGKWVDQVLMRAVDALMCFPTFFLILTAVALLGPSLWNIVIVIGLVSWTGTARLVRAEFLTLREMEYVRAARALGQRAPAIVFRHILPNAAAPIFVTAVLGIPGAILTEAGLSFLGLGVQPPQATWGSIISDAKTYILDAWWLIAFPGAAILIATLAFFLVGDGLRQSISTQTERK